MYTICLPEEIWTIVFKYLSKSDWLKIRSCCKYFKRLIDHPSLWRSEFIVLRKLRSFNDSFWKTLRRRTLLNIRVVNVHGRDWDTIIKNLPWLRAVILEFTGGRTVDSDVLANLNRLTQLKKLVIQSFDHAGSVKKLPSLSQLECLSLCLPPSSVGSNLLEIVSPLSNLTSLHYHEGRSPTPKHIFHAVLNGLPKLKNLSMMWCSNNSWCLPLPDDYFGYAGTALDSSGRGDSGLTSLELLNYTDPLLSPVALDHLPLLEKLTVKYHRGGTHRNTCHLKGWLRSLSHLTELTVNHSQPLGVYADTLPKTLRKLSLSDTWAEPEDLVMMKRTVPDLLHLSYSPFVYNGRSFSEIPKAFEKLQSLQIRYHGLSVKDLAGLGGMQHLRRLVIMGAPADHRDISPELFAQVQMLRARGVQVVLSQVTNDEVQFLCRQCY